MEGRAQLGVVGCVHVDDYEENVIRKHEKTRKDKEDDRTRHVLTLNAHAEPVFLTYRPTPHLRQLDARVMVRTRCTISLAPDGVRQRVWRVHRPRAATAMRFAAMAWLRRRRTSSFGQRLARRGGAARREPAHTGDEEYNWFLAVFFPSNQLRILPYYRVVKDLNGPDAGGVSRARCPGGHPGADHPSRRPSTPGRSDSSRRCVVPLRSTPPASTETIRLARSTCRCCTIASSAAARDRRRAHRPADRFRGGIRGIAELERRVASGEAAVAFAIYPVSVQQLMAIADAGAGDAAQVHLVRTQAQERALRSHARLIGPPGGTQ